MNYSIIIMAAGKGSRMKSNTPKVLHSVAGQPMIGGIIQEALHLSDDLNVILYHEAKRVQSYITSTYPESSNIHTIIQDHDNYPGTGGAVMAAHPKHDRVLVLNGDMPLVHSQALKPLMENPSDVVISTFVLDNPSGYGRVVTENGVVLKIVEEKDASLKEREITRVNAGVYSFSSEFLEHFLPQLDNQNAQGEYYITQLIELAINAGRSVSYCDVDPVTFMGVNSKKELSTAEHLKMMQIKEKWMDLGVIMHLPETIYIEPTVVFEGECEIEAGCVIKGNSVIKNSLIKAHSVIEDGYLENSSAGPMARVRPASRLINSHIGNYVETKKSTLTGVKAGHLSYLGDAMIDEGTNVGAGTITCNYDGKAKYQTIIGKNVFIGSDTQLVAPVTLGDNTMVAAGTTVTQDVEPNALAISRTKQRNVLGFFNKFFGK